MNQYFHNTSNQPLQILFVYLLFFLSKQSNWLKNSENTEFVFSFSCDAQLIYDKKYIHVKSLKNLRYFPGKMLQIA